jgi:hypothetical protein
MKYRNHLIVTFLLLWSFCIQGQTLRSFERAGDLAFQQQDYGAAMQYYRVIVESDRDRDNALWQYAESARHYFALEESLKAYKKLATSDKWRKSQPLIYYRLGEVEQNLGHYETAAGYFEKFLQQKNKYIEEYAAKAKAALESCHWAAAQTQQNARAEVKHLGRGVNSAYSEFAPVVFGDSLYFSSYRFDKKDDGNGAKEKLTRILLSSGGERGREPGYGFPTGADTAHVAHSAFTPDGRYMFFTLCKNIDAKDIRCEVWLTILDRRKRWLPPVRLPEPVNLKDYTTTQPSVAYDSATKGLVLWFSSDRPGGKGKMDIWQTPLDTNWFCPCNIPLPGKPIGKLPKFETPANVAQVNTPENDITPFFHSPSGNLWFSSEGYAGMGGYDIFSARKNPNGFGEPLNAGAGLNSSLNDAYFFLAPNGRDGYLSSNRSGSFYLDARSKACCNDLYSVRLPEIEKPLVPQEPQTVQLAVKTPVLPTLPASAPVLKAGPPLTTPAPAQLQDFVGLPLYFDNDEPDKRTRRNSTIQTYEETVLAYLSQQSKYREEFGGALKDESADAVDHFFETEVRRGYDRLEQLCELLSARLAQGEKIEVHIKGYTSPRAQSDYNLQLSKRRISSVRNHFFAYSEGFFKPFLDSGQLRITEAGFGETTARKDVSDQLEDLRNSVYNPDAARERRVEIVAIREHR